MSMDFVSEQICTYYRNEHKILPDPNGFTDLVISFDGAWEKRRHHSHIGVAFTGEAYTDTVLELEVLSNFCLVFDTMHTRLRRED